jgi:phosphohistidine swiveling domain-containing protein
VPSGRFFEELKNWMEEIVVPAPRDVIDELSRRGYDIITSPTRITSRPVRVVARRTDVPTVPPVEVAEETLYLALLGVLEIVVSGSSEEAAEA